MLDKEEIKNNFSRSAVNYEAHALLQKSLADELFASICELQPRKILDIGCGTGYLTRKLAHHFEDAEVVGIDIAPGMIDVAKKGENSTNLVFVLGDGEKLSFGNKVFDLLVSNASLQWMDFSQVLKEVKRVLSPGGKFLFNTFGPATLKELKELGLRVNAFLSKEELASLTEKEFTASHISSKMVELKFSQVGELVQHLKEIGAQTVDREKQENINIMKTLRQYYKKFNQQKEVLASYEVLKGLLVSTEDR